MTEKPSRYWIKVKNSRYSQLEGREELFERVGKHKVKRPSQPPTFILMCRSSLALYFAPKPDDHRIEGDAPLRAPRA